MPAGSFATFLVQNFSLRSTVRPQASNECRGANRNHQLINITEFWGEIQFGIVRESPHSRQAASKILVRASTLASSSPILVSGGIRWQHRNTYQIVSNLLTVLTAHGTL